MLRREGIDQNIRFLVHEVTEQVARTQRFLHDPQPSLVGKVLSRDDYIDNLKTIIHRKCFAAAARVDQGDSQSLEWLDCADVVSSNLERIADFCEDVVGQVTHMQHPEVLSEADSDAFLDIVLAGLRLVESAVFDHSVDQALRICRAENRLDQLYGKAFHRTLGLFDHDERVQSLVTVLFISHYFERMGDSLLNIGEAVLSACLGERIKIDQYQALEDTLDESEDGESVAAAGVSTAQLQPLGESKSGCRISAVRSSAPDNRRPAVFKEGQIKKLRDERDGIELWQAIDPVLVPHVFSFHENDEDNHASILLEYVSGRTFEDVLLRGEMSDLDSALETILATMTRIWGSTREPEQVASEFLPQLQKRLADVYSLHPHLHQRAHLIGDVAVAPLESILETLCEVESQLSCPFSSFIHGDCNVDNLILDQDTGRVRFIDVHRSRRGDYLQDASVFIVSNLRLQVFDTPLRARINRVATSALERLRRFAEEHEDTSFELRMAFGLARSFITSSRFVLDRDFARNLFSRGRFLLERLAQHPREELTTFRIPTELLRD